MTLDHKHDHLRRLRAAIATVVVYPLQAAVHLPTRLVRRASQSLAPRDRLLEENQRLRRERLLLNARLQRLSALEAENKRLRVLLESSLEQHEKVLVAELMAVELQPFRRQVLINKGARDAVYVGQPVLDSDGIVGQVAHLTPFSSTVLLITDPSHAIPVQVNRNGLRGIAVGTGRDHTLSLEHLPTNVDIREGDLVVSSGLGRRFPRGYPVGTILSISRVYGEPFATVTMTPSAKPGQSAEVLLVWPYEKPDADMAMN